jgi:hypothetical protein
MKSEKERFQKQYSEKQWAKLMKNPNFVAAWESWESNKIRAGEIANIIIEGNEPNIAEARIQRRINKSPLTKLLEDES